MTPDSGSRGSLPYRIGELEAAVHDLEALVTAQNKMLAKLEPIPEEVKSLRKAAYWVAGLIVMGSIGFAFSVLALVPG